MSHYDYHGYQITSSIVACDEIPARVSVRVWKAGANRLHDVPVYFCKSFNQAMKWIDAGANVPVTSVSDRRVLACWY